MMKKAKDLLANQTVVIRNSLKLSLTPEQQEELKDLAEHLKETNDHHRIGWKVISGIYADLWNRKTLDPKTLKRLIMELWDEERQERIEPSCKD